MDAILILLIIFIQFGFGYFSIKYLTDLNEKIIRLNQEIEKAQPEIALSFKKVRLSLNKINQIFELYYKHKNKIKLYKNIIFFKSIILTFLLFKKKKRIKAYFSLYDIINNIIKNLIGFLSKC